MSLLPFKWSLFEYFYPTITNESEFDDDNDYDEFMIHQNFSLPKPIIDYLWKNVTSPNVYQKLTESCKYFNSKKSCVLLKNVSNYQQDEWILKDKNSITRIFNFDIRKYDGMKIWITESLELRDFDNINAASEIMSKVHRCDIQKLDLFGQNLFFHEFVMLTSKVEECYIFDGIIKYEDNEEVPFEIIFQSFPAIKQFEYVFSETATNFNVETMEKVKQLPNFQGIEIFELISIPTYFDILPFYNSIKESKSYKKLGFSFCEGMPEDFKNQIIAINDEILKKKNINFVFPYISFPEYDDELDKFLLAFQGYKSRKYIPRAIKDKDGVSILHDIIFWLYLCLGRPNVSVFICLCLGFLIGLHLFALVFLPMLIAKFINSFM